MIGARDGVAIRATARRNLVGIVADGDRTAAVVSSSHTTVIDRRYFARARHRGVSRDRTDHRRSGVIDRDGLGASSSIAAGVGGSVGAGDDVVAT